MWLAFLARHIEFRRAKTGGQCLQDSVGIGAATDNFEQTAPCIGAIVKAIPTLFEEDVAAHLAGERRAGLPELRLDQRVAGLPHQRHAACRADGGREALRALDVVNDLRALLAGQDVFDQHHQLTVRHDDFAVLGDDAEAIVEKKGLKQVTDTGAIETALDEIIAANPAQVEKARENPKLAGWFVGQVMKATGGKANPKAVNDLVQAKLGG